MFRGIFLFELRYRLTRPVTYIYFGLVFIVCFLVIASPIQRAVGPMLPNAPYLLALWMLVLSWVFTIISSAISGVAVVRDIDHRTADVIFSYPLNSTVYLLGRFAGSFSVLLLINLAVPLGLLTGILLGQIVPWDVAWRGREMLSFHPSHYIQPFFLFTVTNSFVTAALFFTSGALGKKPIIIYMQGVFLMVLYQLANGFLNDLDSRDFAAIIDPFGLQAFQNLTRYWTPVEQNANAIPLDSILIYNRVLWIAIGIASLAWVCFRFSFVVTPAKFKTSIRDVPDDTGAPVANIFDIERIGNNSVSWLKQGVRLGLFYFRQLWVEIPFRVIAATGFIVVIINATKMTAMYGTSSLPTTFSVLALMNSFTFYLVIIAILYSGELYWKERSDNIHAVTDAIPVSTSSVIISKLLALILVYIVLLVLLIVEGVVVQIIYGYRDIRLDVYFGTVFGVTFSYVLMCTLISFFVHVVVNNKFLGFAICVLFFSLQFVLPGLGIEHPLARFASGSLGNFSDMNGYGHFVFGFAWMRIYWSLFSMLLFTIAIAFSLRGYDSLPIMRWRKGNRAMATRWWSVVGAIAILFCLSGTYIYYNTNLLNAFETQNTNAKRWSDYEKVLSGMSTRIQPKVISASLHVELYPSSRRFTASGRYSLVNDSSVPIDEVHVQCPLRDHLAFSDLRFEKMATLVKSYEEFGYRIYRLTTPLATGDSVQFSFTETYEPKGFTANVSAVDLVHNGTFLTSDYFPSIGYNKNFELKDAQLRSQYDLSRPSNTSGKSAGRKQNIFSSDADRLRLHVVVGTDEDQTAVAPGALEKKWRTEARNYFSYQTELPVAKFFTIVSAHYEVKRERWRNVDLEIYHQPGHELNLGKMMQAMKWSLDYCEKNFSPYQFHELRVLEFPRYRAFAQSFPNSIPFSEGVGFVLHARDSAKDLDVATYVTAHEVAHQWWGHQAMPADSVGSDLLSESLCQYSALMVLKHHFSQAVMERYLRYELNAYLSGRSLERNEELPLAEAHSQTYIHYNKASLVFFALQDYIGEEAVNKALRSYLTKWRGKNGHYPESSDLLREIRLQTPDTLQYLIHDMFETITLFENRTDHVVYEEKLDGSFEVSIQTSTIKKRVDSHGNESAIPVDDWIDVGVYAESSPGKEELVYLEKHKVKAGRNSFVIQLKQKPSRAGIDPLCKLIDRHVNDNVVAARRSVEMTGE